MEIFKTEKNVILVNREVENIVIVANESYKEVLEIINQYQQSTNKPFIKTEIAFYQIVNEFENNPEQFNILVDAVINTPNFDENDLIDLSENDEYFENLILREEFENTIILGDDTNYDKILFASDNIYDNNESCETYFKLSDFEDELKEINLTDEVLLAFNTLVGKLNLFEKYVDGDEIDQALQELKNKILTKGKK